MYFTDIAAAAAASLLAVQVSAKTIVIDVGKDGLVFSPDSVKADVGDVLEYHFNNVHSVAMGDFTSGCAPPSKGGFYSGVVKASTTNDVFQVTVNSTDPMPFYCSVGKHCQAGMVGIVNPSSKDSLDKYRDLAKAAQDNKSPDAVFGGKMVPSTDTSANGSPAGPSQTSATTTAAQPAKTGAASQTKASLLGGIGAVALGYAVLLI
ncbi:hypothetical protein E4U43_002696 [Claviceps pusilla]|uniref:Phytocyanin domain-containing protein n=1 Tax=Claviceps pusilla TaxID=123648 RepID=A0A9P7N8H1_9HYPO|nr:hypothetical protein E4U43_002696 [Claviceps pusilla]